ncbi:trimeric intracellular cation channel family protein [Corynebacterium sp. TAE3-ERU12]|uniref:trimeric intracellular cation channel family protein n=1 Tax=Corynebacterium sp. TAE3-ERU12 TaxID=2849491 RepID=UPI001C45592B|nr:trimeric intracellular cation channel family protein [Corynebacterium sp. TAE3-ERU12]MBV7295796.1 trimeric intracellular cation channel family protein [Corynebacterium sp. TAE3-ERU12]
MDVDPTVEAVYQFLDLTGVVINGAIGGTIARQKRFDLVGFAFLALFSALGGGLLRDTFMQKGTPAAFAEPMYMGFALLGGLIAWIAHFEGKVWHYFFRYGDAIILGVWSVTGSMKAMIYGMPWPTAILCGMLTAVGGGMIRDIAVGNVPAIFGGNTIYATPALCGATILVGFYELGYPTVGMIVATTSGAGLAIVAGHRNWVLPGSPEVAPITMTRQQLSRMLARRERDGVLQERRRWRRAQHSDDEIVDPKPDSGASPVADEATTREETKRRGREGSADEQ